jgi:DNA-binding GntR family transcriptional regulator
MAAMSDRTALELPATRNATVLNRLREEIYDGTLAPGTRLRQAHIAKRFGVSTTPIRETFAALEREGLLQSVAHRGVIVFRPTAKDLREIYEIRIPLEVRATEVAVPNLGPEDFESLAKIADKMAKSERKGDFARSKDLNEQFHGTIYAAAHRDRLTSLITDLRASSHAYLRLHSELTPGVEETTIEHKEILAACESGSVKKAGRAVEKHLMHTLKVVLPALERTETQEPEL